MIIDAAARCTKGQGTSNTYFPVFLTVNPVGQTINLLFDIFSPSSLFGSFPAVIPPIFLTSP
jgi:hypothetical protein